MRHASGRVGFMVLAVFGLVAGVAGRNASWAKDPEPQQKVDAPALLKDLDRALAATAKAARAAPDGKLAPKAPAAKPFWTALKRAETSAEKVTTGLKAKLATHVA